MRIFGSAVEAVKEVERDLWEMGHRVHTRTYQDKAEEGGYNSRELIGYDFALTNGSDWQDTFQTLGLQDSKECEQYVELEFIDRLGSATASIKDINPGHSWKARPRVWEPFLEGPNKPLFAYTYAGRLRYNNKLLSLQKLHQLDPASRQLVMPIYTSELDDSSRGGYHRVPCTMHFQLLHRDKELYLIHNMRSCDLYTHFAIDMSVSWLMAQHFQLVWGAECSRLIMQIGSLHGFEKDMKPRGIF